MSSIDNGAIQAAIDNSQPVYAKVDEEQRQMADIKLAVKQFESSGDDDKYRTIYQDSKDIWTVGHGTNLEDLNKEELAILGDDLAGSDTISLDTQDKLLEYNIKQSLSEIETIFTGVAENKVAQKLLVDMHYNMGAPSLSKFINTIKAWDEGDMAGFVSGVKDSDYYKSDVVHNKARYKYVNSLLDKLGEVSTSTTVSDEERSAKIASLAEAIKG